MWVKIVLIILMIAILVSLFQGLFYLAKGGEDGSKKLLRSLTWRIGLSLLLFIVIILLNYFGVIKFRENILPIDQNAEVINEPAKKP